MSAQPVWGGQASPRTPQQRQNGWLSRSSAFERCRPPNRAQTLGPSDVRNIGMAANPFMLPECACGALRGWGMPSEPP
jgi:hypothetical protein